MHTVDMLDVVLDLGLQLLDLRCSRHGASVMTFQSSQPTK